MNTSNITTHFPLPPERLPGGILTQPHIAGDEQIVNFYSNYRGWILDYAETLVIGTKVNADAREQFVTDAGYAFLALINGYFDLIGQVCGNDQSECDCFRQRNQTKFQVAAMHGQKTWALWDNPPDNKDHKPEAERRIWYGLTFVFLDILKAASITPRTSDDWAEFCDAFCNFVRNPVAHVIFPTKLFVSRELRDTNGNEIVAGLLMRSDTGEISFTMNWVLWYKIISDHFDKYALTLRFPDTIDDANLRHSFLHRYPKLTK